MMRSQGFFGTHVTHVVSFPSQPPCPKVPSSFRGTTLNRQLIESFIALLLGLFALGCDGQIEAPPGGGGGVWDPDSLDCGGSLPASAPMRRLTDVQYRNVVRDVFGGAVRSDDLDFPAVAAGLGATGYSTEPAVNPTSYTGVEAMATSAETVALRVVEQLPGLLPCAASGDDACGQEFIDRFGMRAYRRPLTEEERSELFDLFVAARGEPGATFDDGIATVTATLMQAPPFLYQVEIGGAPRDGYATLDGWEIASRLSFLLWDTMPDQALFDDAAAGRLGDAGTRASHARRMLADPKASPVLVRFFREWSGVDRLEASAKDEGWFPEFTPRLAASMDLELELFVQDMVRSGGTVGDLFTSPRSFVDAELAAFYGVPAPGAPDTFVPTELDPNVRPGLLTRPAVLASLAHEQRTSYVHRGVFVLTRVLCQQIPPPPMDAQTREPEYPANATNREKSEIRRTVDECAFCHETIDPVGLAFEHYDAIGRYRETWPEEVGVDASGELPGYLDVGGDVYGVAEMANRFGASETVAECMTRQWFRFSFGRLEDYVDECTVESMVESWSDQDRRLDALIVGITETQAFTRKRIPE